MDVSSVVTGTTTQLSNTRAGGDTQALNVLKAAMETERHLTSEIVNSIPEPASVGNKQSSNPPHLGNNLDVRA